MIDFIKRFRLQQQGLSCGKKRRDREARGLRYFLQNSPVVTGLFLAGVSIVLGSTVMFRPLLGANLADEPIKAILVMLLLFLGGVLHFSITQPRSFQENNRLFLVFGLIALQLTLCKGILGFLETSTLYLGEIRLLLIPYVLAPIMLTVLLGRAHGLFSVFFASFWGCFLVAENRIIAWLVMSLASGIVAVIAAGQARRRQHVVHAGLIGGVAIFILAIMLGHIRGFQEDALMPHNWVQLGWDALVVIGLSLFYGMVASSLLPLVEFFFRITTTATWSELADLNHPLLKRMTVEAPGTYHHSLMVANLAEAAAETIGANPILTRVCAYFHDIGKLKNPEYFIENQPHDANPHDKMTPSMSALVVTSHVKDGIDLALKSKLNTEIIDVIEQHHGTSVAYYFYKRALKKREELMALAAAGRIPETDVPDVEETAFRYPGPKPQTRESAIISLADSIESASRSLEKPTPQRIEQLINDIVNSRILDGQLDESPLTMAEIDEVKDSFANSLRSMLHKRVSYQSDPAPATTTGDSSPAKERNPPTQRLRTIPKFEVLPGAADLNPPTTTPLPVEPAKEGIEPKPKPRRGKTSAA